MTPPPKPIPETICAGHPRRIENDPVIGQEVGEAIFRNQYDQRGGEADQSVSPEPGALPPDFALKADQRRGEQREAQLGELETLGRPGMLDMIKSEFHPVARPRSAPTPPKLAPVDELTRAWERLEKLGNRARI
jgi:hypothetical protein